MGAVSDFKVRCSVNVLRVDYEVVMDTFRVAGLSYSRVIAMITSALACHFRRRSDWQKQDVRRVVYSIVDCIHSEHIGCVDN